MIKKHFVIIKHTKVMILEGVSVTIIISMFDSLDSLHEECDNNQTVFAKRK